MVCSLMTPTITPLVAQDWYRMVVSASNEEENNHNQQENQQLGEEKKLFCYDFDFLALLKNTKDSENNFFIWKNRCPSPMIYFPSRAKGVANI